MNVEMKGGKDKNKRYFTNQVMATSKTILGCRLSGYIWIISVDKYHGVQWAGSRMQIQPQLVTFNFI